MHILISTPEVGYEGCNPEQLRTDSRGIDKQACLEKYKILKPSPCFFEVVKENGKL